MHGSKPDCLLQTIPGLPPNHAIVLQDYFDSSRPVSNDSTSFDIEVRSCALDQSFQPYALPSAETSRTSSVLIAYKLLSSWKPVFQVLELRKSALPLALTTLVVLMPLAFVVASGSFGTSTTQPWTSSLSLTRPFTLLSR